MKKSGFPLVLIFLFAFLVALCSIVYELMFSQLLTILFGGTVTRYSITIGLFLCSLGIGSFLFGYIKTKPEKLFVIIELLITAIGFLGIITIIKVTAWVMTLKTITLSQPTLISLTYIPIILVGLISGIEIPLLAKLGENYSKTKNIFGKVLGFDYFGSLIGTIIFALILYPKLGIVASAFIISAINLAVAAIVAFTYTKQNLLKILTVIFIFGYILLTPSINSLQDDLIKDFRGKKIFQYQNTKDDFSYNITKFSSTLYQDVIFADITSKKDNGINTSCVYLDNDLQFCTNTVKPYHAGMVEFPMQFIDPNKKIDVLIIGGGDFIGVNSLLQFNNINKVDIVDIDKEFAEMAKTHPFITQFNKHAFTTKKLNVLYEDGFSFVLNTENMYDLILLDLPGVSHDKLSHLYSVEFFSNTNRILTKDGLLVSWLYFEQVQQKHYQILMQVLYESYFKNMIRYFAYDNKGGIIEQFMVLSNTQKKKFNITTPYLNQAATWYQNADPQWEELIPTDTKVHSIFKPNYGIVVKPPFF